MCCTRYLFYNNLGRIVVSKCAQVIQSLPTTISLYYSKQFTINTTHIMFSEKKKKIFLGSFFHSSAKTCQLHDCNDIVYGNSILFFPPVKLYVLLFYRRFLHNFRISKIPYRLFAFVPLSGYTQNPFVSYLFESFT